MRFILKKVDIKFHCCCGHPFNHTHQCTYISYATTNDVRINEISLCSFIVQQEGNLLLFIYKFILLFPINFSIQVASMSIAEEYKVSNNLYFVYEKKCRFQGTRIISHLHIFSFIIIAIWRIYFHNWTFWANHDLKMKRKMREDSQIDILEGKSIFLLCYEFHTLHTQKKVICKFY